MNTTSRNVVSSGRREQLALESSLWSAVELFLRLPCPKNWVSRLVLHNLSGDVLFLCARLWILKCHLTVLFVGGGSTSPCLTASCCTLDWSISRWSTPDPSFLCPMNFPRVSAAPLPFRMQISTPAETSAAGLLLTINYINSTSQRAQITRRRRDKSSY